MQYRQLYYNDILAFEYMSKLKSSVYYNRLVLLQSLFHCVRKMKEGIQIASFEIQLSKIHTNLDCMKQQFFIHQCV
jgi:hypothetical protein